MLENDFYTVREFQQNGDSIRAVLDINPKHRIFEGHFPGQPVVPGVCMMQMQKELLQKAIGKDTRLIKADHAKFLSMIDPRVNHQITAAIRFENTPDDTISLTGSFVSGDIVFFKYKAVFGYP